VQEAQSTAHKHYSTTWKWYDRENSFYNTGLLLAVEQPHVKLRKIQQNILITEHINETILEHNQWFSMTPLIWYGPFSILSFSIESLFIARGHLFSSTKIKPSPRLLQHLAAKSIRENNKKCWRRGWRYHDLDWPKETAVNILEVKCSFVRQASPT
jgi:hypothetical protein